MVIYMFISFSWWTILLTEKNKETMRRNKLKAQEYKSKNKTRAKSEIYSLTKRRDLNRKITQENKKLK